MNHLTDRELIDYTLKFDNDSVRVRLAKIMDNMPGIILDELEYAGMDPESCTFENTYSPGQYVRHLENEIEYLNNEISDLADKLRKKEMMSLTDFILEMKDKISSLQTDVIVAQQDRDSALLAKKRTDEKMKVWTALSTDMTRK